MYVPAWPSLSPSHFVPSAPASPLPFPLGSHRSMYFYLARNGIYHLFRKLGLREQDVVLVPDYHHGNEIFAMRAAGVSIRYYPIQRNLNADLDAIERLCKLRPKALYVTHFIGWPQPMKQIRALCRKHEMLLIEDCALSLLSSYEGAPLGSFGDFAVFCLYKTLPVPNGGVVVQNDSNSTLLQDMQLQPCNRISVAARSTELMLHWVRIHNPSCGKVLAAAKRRAGR